MNWKKIIVFFVVIVCLNGLKANFQNGGDKSGYCQMRVFDCNKSVGLGSMYVNSSIIIAYENGEVETIALKNFSESTESDNLKIVVETLNKLKQKGYLLMSTSTTGEQGSLITDYILLKQF